MRDLELDRSNLVAVPSVVVVRNSDSLVHILHGRGTGELDQV